MRFSLMPLHLCQPRSQLTLAFVCLANTQLSRIPPSLQKYNALETRFIAFHSVDRLNPRRERFQCRHTVRYVATEWLASTLGTMHQYCTSMRLRTRHCNLPARRPILPCSSSRPGHFKNPDRSRLRVIDAMPYQKNCIITCRFLHVNPVSRINIAQAVYLVLCNLIAHPEPAGSRNRPV
ncbi:hypothetical protein F4677DRAFT_131265 [Hypoxylon crocopeplum]|nr:hypothetical protein F4677DRAFT_131265 [Hypoxylon crocopeplum]